MNNKETRQYEMLIRVGDFGRAHRDLFPESSPAGKAFGAVDSAVTELNVHAASKMSSHGAARDGGEARAAARAAVREQVDAISRTARVMAEENPDLLDKFRVPDARTDRALLTSARLYVRDSEAFEAEFLANGMSQTFRAELNTAIERLEHSLHGRDAGRSEHAAAQAGIAAALENGLAALRKLDVIVVNRLRDDPVTMAGWERERRVLHGRAAARADAGPDATPSASVPATSAATTPSLASAER